MNDQAIEMSMLIKKENRSIHQHDQEKSDGDNEEMMEHRSTTNNTNNDISTVILLDNHKSVNKGQYIEKNLTNNSAIQSSHLSQSIAAEYQWISPPIKTNRKTTKYSNLSIDHWKRSSKLVPNYSKLPNYLFQHLLSKAIPRYRHKIQQWLTNAKILQFIRQRAELMSTIFQLKIEQDYWANMVNIAMPAITWLSTIFKNVTRRNSINWDYPRTENNIKHRQNIIENKIQQAEDDLNAHLKQQYPLPWLIQNITSMDHSMNIISQALVVLIQNGLQQLRTNFEQKKILLKFDVNDVYLVKSFYDLNPTEEQIRSIQKIWRVKFKLCKRTIGQIKDTSTGMKQIATTETKIQDNISTITTNHRDEFYDDDHDHQQDQLCSIESFVPSMRTIVDARLANIEQRTQQIIKFINASTL